MAVLLRSQLRWAGHVHRMDDCRLPKRLLYGKLTLEKRSHGGQKKRYKDTLKGSLKSCHIPHINWEEAAKDRLVWRSLVGSGVGKFEKRRIHDNEQKRWRRKDREISTPQPDPAQQIVCPLCNRHFRARIGLISHLRTHPTPQ